MDKVTGGAALHSAQFSPLANWVVTSTRQMVQQRSSFNSFLPEAIVSSSGMGRDASSLMLSIQHFTLPTTTSPSLQGALKGGFGEAVVGSLSG